MIQTFIKNGQVRSYNVVNDKVVVTIKIDGRWVSNPSYDDFIADGWQPYTPPAPEPPTKDEQYENRAIELIRNKYTIDQELSRLRQKEAKTTLYKEYYEYCEACKKQAYEEVYGKEPPADLAPKQDERNDEHTLTK